MYSNPVGDGVFMSVSKNAMSVGERRDDVFLEDFEGVLVGFLGDMRCIMIS